MEKLPEVSYPNHPIDNEERVKTIKEIINDIDVTYPYYSLRNLQLKGSDILATIQAEQPMENEAGTISAAEVGRHLAILGSCALAKDNKPKNKNYFLAYEAQLEVSKSNNSIINTDNEFWGLLQRCR